MDLETKKIADKLDEMDNDKEYNSMVANYIRDLEYKIDELEKEKSELQFMIDELNARD